jgi:hypothetical protein
MSRPGLSKLYRRLTRRRPTASALPRVETLLALAEGEHGAETERMLADVGRSGLHADLLRFARALAPESARLGVQLEQTFDVPAAAHRRGQRSSRNVAARRGWLRAGGALAAGLLVAVAVWSFQRSHSLPQSSVAVAKQPVPDRIFAALNERSAASNNKGDQIFRADFKSDHIFKFSDG